MVLSSFFIVYCMTLISAIKEDCNGMYGIDILPKAVCLVIRCSIQIYILVA